MITTLKKISDVLRSVEAKPIDKVKSYLLLSEILKILYNDNIIHFSSYLHFQWKADYEIMIDRMNGVSRGTIIALIAEKYNRSPKAVENYIYNIKGR